MRGFFQIAKRNWKMELLTLLLFVTIASMFSLTISLSFNISKEIRSDNKAYYKNYLGVYHSFNEKDGVIDFPFKKDIENSKIELEKSNYNIGFVYSSINTLIDKNVVKNIDFPIIKGPGFSDTINSDYDEAIISVQSLDLTGAKVGDIITRYKYDSGSGVVEGNVQDNASPVKIVGVFSGYGLNAGSFFYDESKTLTQVKRVSKDTHLVIKKEGIDDFPLKNNGYNNVSVFVFNATEKKDINLGNNNYLMIDNFPLENSYILDINISKDMLNITILLLIISITILVSIVYLNIKNLRLVNSLYILHGQTKKGLILHEVIKLIIYMAFSSIIAICFKITNMASNQSILLSFLMTISMFIGAQLIKYVIIITTNIAQQINKEN